VLLVVHSQQVKHALFGVKPASFGLCMANPSVYPSHAQYLFVGAELWMISWDNAKEDRSLVRSSTLYHI
jgi:hypothetical protein